MQDILACMKMPLGKFVNSDCEAIGKQEPGADEAFPILCGPWPNPNAGAVRRLCSVCGKSVGLSPRGLAYHDALPDLRPMLCEGCYFAMVAVAQIFGL